ncbi:uncharacterized protein VP01_2517g2 [Puccinia sorghi]|uniref:Uncharacterized protein n=1 Tax=Puccinia sorghi TaxID=27349 RepID=A0A0L6V7D2_9BASI|nr:uncharacterized protein VP01_2517g2 [Puccinia sorghi]
MLESLPVSSQSARRVLKGAPRIIGDLAKTFSYGQTKALLDKQWIVEALKT